MSASRRSPNPKKLNSEKIGAGTKFPPSKIEPRLLLMGRTPILVPKFWGVVLTVQAGLFACCAWVGKWYLSLYSKKGRLVFVVVGGRRCVVRCGGFGIC